MGAIMNKREQKAVVQSVLMRHISIEHLIHYVCPCGEPFDRPVWHCPLCHHHWTKGSGECRNCHKISEQPITGIVVQDEWRLAK